MDALTWGQIITRILWQLLPVWGALVVTFGLSIALQNGMLEVFSADSQRMRTGALESASIDLGPVTVGIMPLLTFASAVVVIFALNQIFYRTALGRAFRATSDDAVTAQLRIWDSVRVARLMSRLIDCERALKSSGTPGGVLFRKLMTDIAHQAARAR